MIGQRNDIFILDKGYEKEEYIIRLHREKCSEAERHFEERVMEGSF